MPVNHFDQASRFAAQLDSAEFLRWLLGLNADECTFRGWLDTRGVPFPGDTDRVSDTVAHLTDELRNGVPWAVAVEFQSQPDPTMFARLLAYLSGLWLHCKPDAGRGSRFHVGAAVVNLTGIGSAARDLSWPEIGLQTSLQIVERNLGDESAADLVSQIEGGRWSRNLLPWVPLMFGGEQADTIVRWKALALAEPDRRRKAELGGLALVFADKAGCKEIWEQHLEGWNVEESSVVNGWIAVAEARGVALGEARGKEVGSMEEAQAAVLRLGTKKFGPASEEVAATVRAIRDRARLERMLDRVLDAMNWDEVVATA